MVISFYMIDEYDTCLKSWFNIFLYFVSIYFQLLLLGTLTLPGQTGRWRLASSSPAWSLFHVHQRKNIFSSFWQTSHLCPSFVLRLQCGSGQDRLLYRAGRNAGHGRVWRSGGHLQLCEDPLLTSYQHDPNRGADPHIFTHNSLYPDMAGGLANDTSCICIVMSSVGVAMNIQNV